MIDYYLWQHFGEMVSMILIVYILQCIIRVIVSPILFLFTCRSLCWLLLLMMVHSIHWFVFGSIYCHRWIDQVFHYHSVTPWQSVLCHRGWGCYYCHCHCHCWTTVQWYTPKYCCCWAVWLSIDRMADPLEWICCRACMSVGFDSFPKLNFDYRYINSSHFWWNRHLYRPLPQGVIYVLEPIDSIVSFIWQ